MTNQTINLNEPFAFTVCRIEPENNIHIILKAFSEIQMMPLVIVGNWKYCKYGKELYQQYSSFDGINLYDPIYDNEKLNILRGHCSLYLHGHSCGGTNPSLVEAMYLGLPIAAFNVNFNRETTENKALYFDDSEDLKRIISSVTLDELKELGNKMKEIADRRYTWKRIRECYAKLF